jgi:hypothetical protein
MKKIILFSLICMGIMLIVPLKVNAGLFGSCNIDTGYIGGEINGVYYDMIDAFTSKDLTDEQKLMIFKQGCKEEPRVCCGESEMYKFKAPMCMMKSFYVDAVCSNSKAVAEYILSTGSLTDHDTLIPSTGDSSDSPYENFRVSLGGFAAYVGRTEILKYMMHEMPRNGKVSRTTMGDKAYTLDKEHLVTIDKTLYEVALSGRKKDDVENPTTKPFITFIQAEKQKWDASQALAVKIREDFIKAGNGGKLAIDNLYEGKNLAINDRTYKEISRLLKLQRI